MQAYLIDAAAGTIEPVQYFCWADLGPEYLDCDRAEVAYEFPWGDLLLATDPVPVGAEYFRITALNDGSGAEHEGSPPIGYKAVLIGPNVAPSDNHGEDFLSPFLDINTLGDWLEVLP